MFRLDIDAAAAPAVTGQWIYPLDVNTGSTGPFADKVSAMVWLGPDKLAIEERDDPANDPNDNPQNTVNTRLYLADFTRATQIPSDSTWNALTPSASTGGKSLEQWYIPGQGPDPADLPVAGPKCLWVDVARALRDAGYTDPNAPAGTTRQGREDRGHRVRSGWWIQPGAARAAQRQRLRSREADQRAVERAHGPCRLHAFLTVHAEEARP